LINIFVGVNFLRADLFGVLKLSVTHHLYHREEKWTGYFF
jgi:hypothetical protein